MLEFNVSLCQLEGQGVELGLGSQSRSMRSGLDVYVGPLVSSSQSMFLLPCIADLILPTTGLQPRQSDQWPVLVATHEFRTCAAERMAPNLCWGTGALWERCVGRTSVGRKAPTPTPSAWLRTWPVLLQADLVHTEDLPAAVLQDPSCLSYRKISLRKEKGAASY